MTTQIKWWVLGFMTIFVQLSTAQTSEINTKEDKPSTVVTYKLTPSYYQVSDGNDAMDVNLRMNLGLHTIWLGEYLDKTGYRQARTGYEKRIGGDLLRWVLSAQLASGGFFGGSVNAEIGGDTFALLGFGRTNLRDYYNLNFDPNDAITFGIGTRAIHNTELSFFQVKDDRLDTGQRVNHLVWRYKPSVTQRLTVDAAYKRGFTSGGNFINGYGLSFTYDQDAYFVRIARDQYANFNDNHISRFSLGMRF